MGMLVAIYIAERAGGPMRSVDTAELVTGKGIVGDRYFEGTGKWSPAVQSPKNEITLIDAEQIEHFNSTYGTALHPEQLRRNLVTNGIGLNDLVEAEFSVGDVVLKGIKLCEPCEYLAGLTRPDIVVGLTHRAGLRAGIVQGGVINLGDHVTIR